MAPAQAAVRDTVARLAPISLEEVLAAAELQTRVDRKYVVPLDVFVSVLDQLAGELSVLEIAGLRMFQYESVYFDTPELASYSQHARGRRRRVKVRTRAYLDSDDCLLEFKRVGARGETIKERYPYALTERFRLDGSARSMVGDRVGDLICAASLEPVLTTAYVRITLVDARRGARTTCDLALRFSDTYGRTYGPLDQLVILESKTTGALSPVDRLLFAKGRRPMSLSKYCVGMAVLDPTLPANRWNRELRTWFGWTPVRPWEGASEGASELRTSPQGPRPAR